jgi:hypothetical protein
MSKTPVAKPMVEVKGRNAFNGYAGVGRDFKAEDR